MYRGMDENELYYLYRQGCPIAKKELISFMYDHAKLVLPRYLRNQDIANDYIQEIVLYCAVAIDGYRPEKGTCIRSFINLMMHRKVSNYLVRSYGILAYKTNVIYSLDEEYSSKDNNTFIDAVADSKEDYLPDKQLNVLQQEKLISEYVNSAFSKLEKIVLIKTCQGYADRDIAFNLEVGIKKVSNTKYRLRKKLADLKLFD